MKNSQEIKLDSSLLIGSGSQRDCYRHPFEPSLCLKISRSDLPSHRSQNELEFKYHSLLLSRGVDLSRINFCRGQVSTNLGLANVYEDLSKVSGVQPLESLVLEGGIDHRELYFECRSIIDYFLRESIVVSDFHFGNIFYRRALEPGSRFFMIDGVYNRDFIKMSSYFNFMGKLKVQRMWRRFLVLHERSFFP